VTVGEPVLHDEEMNPSERPLVRFLGHGAERSGPPIYLLRLFRWWAEHDPGFDVELVLARPGPLVPQYQALVTTRVARLDRRSPERLVERGLNGVGAGAAGRAMVDGAIRLRARSPRRPTITVVNSAAGGTAHLLRALGEDQPFVVITHELSTGWFNNITEPERALLLRSARFLAVSQCVEQFLADDLLVDPARISMIPEVVDQSDRPAKAEASGQRPVVVGGGGMTDWRKAPEIWLRVAHETLRLAPDLDFKFVWFGGEAPGSAAFWPLSHEIEHLGLGDIVHFVGDVSDPAAITAEMDVFVSTAREDAYPLVCAEAAMTGIPVIAFDCGGAAELIADADCGVIVAYPDVEAMARHVVELARDEGRRVALGQHGRAFALEHLDVSVVASRVGDWVLSGSMS
jgi:glycosyltransferase involved in cell wall biosynthesis